MSNLVGLTLHVNGTPYKAKQWPQAPSTGQQIGVTLDGQHRVATVRNVCWREDGLHADVYMTVPVRVAASAAAGAHAQGAMGEVG